MIRTVSGDEILVNFYKHGTWMAEVRFNAEGKETYRQGRQKKELLGDLGVTGPNAAYFNVTLALGQRMNPQEKSE